jgi:phosphotransferase system enzyme I (PtsI)
MCGELASDSHFTRLLLGLGIDEFSVAPAFIPKIKKVIRSTHLGEARKLTDEIMNAPDFSAAQERLNKIKLSLA